jgi:hypothetical protein
LFFPIFEYIFLSYYIDIGGLHSSTFFSAPEMSASAFAEQEHGVWDQDDDDTTADDDGAISSVTESDEEVSIDSWDITSLDSNISPKRDISEAFIGMIHPASTITRDQIHVTMLALKEEGTMSSFFIRGKRIIFTICDPLKLSETIAKQLLEYRLGCKLCFVYVLPKEKVISATLELQTQPSSICEEECPICKRKYRAPYRKPVGPTIDTYYQRAHCRHTVCNECSEDQYRAKHASCVICRKSIRSWLRCKWGGHPY